MRLATPDDVQDLAPLCAEHAAFEGCTARLDAQWAARLRQALQQRRLWIWLAHAMDDGRLIGYASATLDYATLSADAFLHLDCLYLRPHARGLGLGPVLMQAVQAQARAEGCQQLQWQTPQWNEAAARFYRRLGAQMLPKQRFVLPL